MHAYATQLLKIAVAGARAQCERALVSTLEHVHCWKLTYLLIMAQIRSTQPPAGDGAVGRLGPTSKQPSD